MYIIIQEGRLNYGLQIVSADALQRKLACNLTVNQNVPQCVWRGDLVFAAENREWLLENIKCTNV